MIAGYVEIDATVKPSRVKGTIVHAAIQADADQALARLLKEDEVPETFDVTIIRLSRGG